MSSKRARSSSPTGEESLSSIEIQAKTTALNLLESTLGRYSLVENSKLKFLSDVARALAIPEKDISDKYGTSKKARARQRDEHNEVCEVCETGGDLLCCETCTLVYHLSCLRPKISSIPKGSWSCVNCIIDGVAEGDIDEAKDSLDRMNRLAGRLAQKRSETGEESGGPSLMQKAKLAIGRAGRYYTILNSENVELGRFSSLETVFAYVKKVIKTKCYPSNKINNADSKVDVDSLWCTHCIDDPLITLCVFCGCQVCFGKHDSKQLLLCDGCDKECHTYCLTPPMTSIPSEAWFCEQCQLRGIAQSRLAQAGNEEEEGEEAAEQGAQQHTVSRGRGRPSGKLKQLDQLTGLGGPSLTRSNTSASVASLMRYKGSGTAGLVRSASGTTVGVAIANEPDVVNTQVVLYFIQAKTDPSFTSSEKAILEQLRRWAPLCDLKIVFEALAHKNRELVARNPSVSTNAGAIGSTFVSDDIMNPSAACQLA